MRLVKPEDERTLLTMLRDGDATAFEELYSRYSARIYGNIYKLVKCTDTADDILQDVFINIWEKRANIDPDKSFRSYLFVCSRHLVLNFFRRVSVENIVEAFLAANSTELYSHIEEEMAYRETGIALDNIINQLPDKRKAVYRLCKLEGLSYKAVAEQLGISPATVHDHLVKANHFIKEKLSDRDNTSIAGLITLLVLMQR